MRVTDFEREHVFPAGFVYIRRNSSHLIYRHAVTGVMYSFSPDCGVSEMSPPTTENALAHLRQACLKAAHYADARGLPGGRDYMTISKLCTGCGRTLTAEGFNRNRTMRDGLSKYCRDCRREQAQAAKRGESWHSWQYRTGTQEATRVAMTSPTTQDAVSSNGLHPFAEEAAEMVTFVTADAAVHVLDLASSAVEDTTPHSSIVALPATPAVEHGPHEPMALADFLALREAPSVLVHPRFCVLIVPLGNDDDQQNGSEAPEVLHFIVTPDSTGPRAMVPTALVAYIVGLLAQERSDKIVGQAYF